MDYTNITNTGQITREHFVKFGYSNTSAESNTSVDSNTSEDLFNSIYNVTSDFY